MSQPRKLLVQLLGLLIILAGLGRPVSAQIAALEGRAVPRQSYFLAFVPYNPGE